MPMLWELKKRILRLRCGRFNGLLMSLHKILNNLNWNKTQPKNKVPVVFIGSSTEARDWAKEVANSLTPTCQCLPWYEVFQPGSTFDRTLINTMNDSDFSVFILTADDVGQSRGIDYFTPRDNIVFESGISFGSLGVERTFIIPEKTIKLKIPTDWSGFILTSGFDRNKNIHKELLCPVGEILKGISKLGRKEKIIDPLSPEEIKREAIDLINSASRNIILFGRDLSWASYYSVALREAKKLSVSIEVLCEHSTDINILQNAKNLERTGAVVYYCAIDPGWRLTMIDTHDEKISRFMLCFKERDPATGSFIYRRELHTSCNDCLLYTSPSPRDGLLSRMPSSA